MDVTASIRKYIMKIDSSMNTELLATLSPQMPINISKLIPKTETPI